MKINIEIDTENKAIKIPAEAFGNGARESDEIKRPLEQDDIDDAESYLYEGNAEELIEAIEEAVGKVLVDVPDSEVTTIVVSVDRVQFDDDSEVNIVD